MAGEVLYRKYRSRSFDTVVGQDAIIRSLTGALTAGRISHAYLFTGPRGVGKTSVARLLARAIACSGEGILCGTCDRCADQSPIDIIEIDAASNNSVDDVRALREKIHSAPAVAKYKTYIIDEVHMLSSGAFNALLKTLEEPPAHAVFILATTETHKLPETIISRTQVFSFKPIPEDVMVPHLSSIAESESIEAEPEALRLIAHLSQGGFRDAISLLDQVSSSSGGKATQDGVRELLGLGSGEIISSLSTAVAQGDAAAAIKALDAGTASGAAPAQLISQLIRYWRAINRAAAGLADEPLEPAQQEIVKKLAPQQIARVLDTFIEVSRSPWPLPSLEAALVRVCAPEPAPSPPPASGGAAAAPAPAPKAAAPAPKSDPAPSAPSAPSAVTSELWPKVLSVVKRENNSLYALLQMYPLDFTDEAITIKTKFNFHRDLFLKPTNRSTVETALQKVYGRPLGFHAVTEAGAAAAPNHGGEPKPSEELAAAALEILGGEMIE